MIVLDVTGDPRAVQLSPIGSERSKLPSTNPKNGTVHKDFFFLREVHKDFALTELETDSPSTEDGFEFQQFSCIRKMKCKGANQTLVVHKISSQKNRKKKLYSNSMIGHCCCNMSLLFDPPRNLPK
jgi:hypothetical protein